MSLRIVLDCLILSAIVLSGGYFCVYFSLRLRKLGKATVEEKDKRKVMQIRLGSMLTITIGLAACVLGILVLDNTKPKHLHSKLCSTQNLMLALGPVIDV
jgi:hypothetical protein